MLCLLAECRNWCKAHPASARYRMQLQTLLPQQVFSHIELTVLLRLNEDASNHNSTIQVQDGLNTANSRQNSGVLQDQARAAAIPQLSKLTPDHGPGSSEQTTRSSCRSGDPRRRAPWHQHQPSVKTKQTVSSACCWLQSSARTIETEQNCLQPDNRSEPEIFLFGNRAPWPLGS